MRRFDAGSYVRLTEMMNAHDVGRGRGGVAAGLARVRARSWSPASRSDRLYPLSEQAELAERIPNAGAAAVIDSPYGHDGFLIETPARRGSARRAARPGRSGLSCGDTVSQGNHRVGFVCSDGRHTTVWTLPMTASETDHDKRTPSRIDWVDAAKGMSILLVVLHHVVILSEPHGLVPGPVSALNTALASLRMPLFFLASGLFAAAPLAASWRTLLHKRVAFFLYLFVLWTLLQSVVFLALPADVLPPDSPASWVDVAWEALLPGPAMWFLYALAVFSILGKLVRRTPAWAQLVVSGALCAVVGAGLVTFESFAWTFMARYLFFFLLGVHARAVVETVAERSSLLLVVAGGALWVRRRVRRWRSVPATWSGSRSRRTSSP